MVHARGCSHLRFLLDFEEFCHVGKVFLVGFSHLLLCSLRIHDLQPLQTTRRRVMSYSRSSGDPKGKGLMCSYLEGSERHAGARSWGAVSHRGLSSVRHALLLQRSLLRVTKQYGHLQGWKKSVSSCRGEKWANEGFTWRDLEILALVASLTWACLTRPLPLFPSWPRLKPRSSW